MRTGPSDSAGPPQEPGPPLPDGGRYSWLVKSGRHPVTWAAVALILLGTGGLAVLLHQPGGRARAQNVYCGLVTCAVVRAVAARSGVAHSAVGVPSPLATGKTPTPSPAHVPSPQPTGGRAAAPSGALAPTRTHASKPTPGPTSTCPPRWPWPFRWLPHRWGTGGHPGSDSQHGC
jgi:hypothetical protein